LLEGGGNNLGSTAGLSSASAQTAVSKQPEARLKNNDFNNMGVN